MRCCCHQHINFKQYSAPVAYTMSRRKLLRIFGRTDKLSRHNNDNDHISRPHSNDLVCFMHEQLTQVNAALSLVWYLCCPFIDFHLYSHLPKCLLISAAFRGRPFCCSQKHFPLQSISRNDVAYFVPFFFLSF